MVKKEMIAMLLAGGQGSRLGVLTANVAKPAVAFGGKYRIIDFDTVGVLTQYRHLRLNTHIGIGIPWDLDRNNGGVTLLPPYEKSSNSDWYTGTANAIFQNLEYIESYNPEYVLILGGDHIYKMDYQVMLDFHKSRNADVTIACMPVPWEEASRFGVVVADDKGNIKEFEEKPEKPSSNLASMGIYIFNWKLLRDALIVGFYADDTILVDGIIENRPVISTHITHFFDFLPLLVPSITIRTAPIIRMIFSAKPIKAGEKTSSQDHSIMWSSFKTTKMIVSTPRTPRPADPI